MIGDGISQITAEDVDALTRIFDLFPHVGGLDVTTSAGPLRVSRDFPSAGSINCSPAFSSATWPSPASPFRQPASVAKSPPMKWIAV